MAQHQSAKKRIRSSERKRQRNKAMASKTISLTNKVLSTKDQEKANQYLKEAVSTIDKSVSKGRMHRNTAARKKSVLNRHINALNTKKEN